MIPFILWQTAKSREETEQNERLTQLINSVTMRNPELEYRFMDDIQCEKFIRDNFNEEFFEMYTSLPLGIMRADLWRIAVLYIHGGVYMDTDVFCKQNILPLLDFDGLIVSRESFEHQYKNNVSNFWMASPPKNPILKRTLDRMFKMFHIVFDKESDFLVQNFGMDLFQKELDASTDIDRLKVIPKSIIDNYIDHHNHGTWRESEHTYRDTRFMKPITFFTTFNQSGYDLYGKSWIKTFIKNVAPRGSHIKAKVYAHGVDKVDVNHPQVDVIDYDKAIRHHPAWKEDYLKRNHHGHGGYVEKMTVRFSHKAMVIQEVLSNIKEGYAIWLDGDCVMHEADYIDFPNNLLNGKALSCQVEHTRDLNHVESGVLIFDTEHPDTKLWNDNFKENYSVDNVIDMGEPYDGFIVYKSVLTSGIEYNNLNEEFGKVGIQSCPTLTFLHPVIKEHFTHNIGLTGKSSYDDWEDVKYSDEVFSRLAGVGQLSAQQKRIRELKRLR